MLSMILKESCRPQTLELRTSTPDFPFTRKTTRLPAHSLPLLPLRSLPALRGGQGAENSRPLIDGEPAA